MIAVPPKEAARISKDALAERAGNSSATSDRLDGWKEIGTYLRRSTRCVQRWERMEGLPVLRRRHAKGATVYAYRHEVDQWWREGRTGSC
jgi:hypothetical protein